jgi:hypothetical protein
LFKFKNAWILMLVLALFAFGLFGCGDDTAAPVDETPEGENGEAEAGLKDRFYLELWFR